MSRKTDAVLKELRAWGLSHFPGAHTKSPWPGHLDLAVNDKTFAYLSIEGEPFAISCKLPATSHMALMLPFCKPTPYGLGKSGWVSASFDDKTPPDVDMLEAWIDESYRAQAPKKLQKQLASGDVPPAPARKPTPATKPKPKPKPNSKPEAAAKPKKKTRVTKSNKR